MLRVKTIANLNYQAKYNLCLHKYHVITVFWTKIRITSRAFYSLCDARLFRLARILLIEKEINRRMRGLIKFYDCRRIMQVHTAALSMIHLHLHERPILERAHSLSPSLFLRLAFSLWLLHTRLHLYTSDCIALRRKQQVQEITNRPAVASRFTRFRCYNVRPLPEFRTKISASLC